MEKVSIQEFRERNNRLQTSLKLQENLIPHSVHEDKQNLTVQKKESLQTTFNCLPIQIKEIMQNIQLPDDDGKRLIDAIHKEGAIGASDGFLKQSKGGYAFSIQSYQSDEGRIEGGGKVLCSNGTTSLTAELYGMIGLLSTILLVCTQHSQELNITKEILVTTDNDEVVKQLTNESEPMNVSETWAPEYDLGQLMWEIKTAIPIRVTVKWVKGHQDELENGQKIKGPFTREAQLNILMDKRANKERDDINSEPPIQHTYKYTAIGLYHHKNVIITYITSFIYNNNNSKKICEYIQRKYNWNNLEQELIDWNSLEKAIKKYSEFKKSIMVQLLYNWQNDGHQKQHFNSNAQSECPAKCGQLETHNHYLFCEEKSMIESREIKGRILKQYFLIRNTHPYIINTIMQYLQYGTEETLLRMGDPVDHISKKTREAVEENMHLSKESFEKGFISTKWQEAQNQWSRTMAGPKKRQQQWGRDLVIGLQTYTYDVWKTCNKKLHGSNSVEANKIKTEKCIQRVKEPYSMSRKQLLTKDKALFCHCTVEN